MNRSALSWAVGGALRLAIGTAVIALVLATTLTGEAGERLATTAYLAAIFAAVALVVQRFLPASDETRSAAGAAAFPSFLTYSTAVAILVTIAAALASEPGAEAFAFAGCAALVAIAVLARTGALAKFNAALMRGGFFVAAARYAAAVSVLSLLIAAFVPADSLESVATFAYRLAAIATICVAASLVAPTRFGIWIARSSVRLVGALDRLARAFVFERTATYAAVVAIAAILSASLLPMPFAEPFAVAAYAATLAAALGVAMECRRLRS